MFKFNNRNDRKRCEIGCSGVFIVNFEHIFTTSYSAFIVGLEQVNVSLVEAENWSFSKYENKKWISGSLPGKPLLVQSQQ